jgi:hypothetical protein
LGRQVLVEQRPHVFGLVITFVAERRVWQFPAGTQVLQCPFGDVQQTTNFNVVHSAAFGRRVEMTVEPSHRIGQSAGIGLQIRPSTFFD